MDVGVNAGDTVPQAPGLLLPQVTLHCTPSSEESPVTVAVSRVLPSVLTLSAAAVRFTEMVGVETIVAAAVAVSVAAAAAVAVIVTVPPVGMVDGDLYRTAPPLAV
jgi:hypothetical protein